MANKKLFNFLRTKNHAGGRAHVLNDREALARLATTGSLASTFYVSAEAQLAEVLDYAKRVDPIYLAKVAIHARQEGSMKDLPVILLALLSTRDKLLFEKAFFKVVDDARQLRTFVQILRSGVLGRKSLGSQPKRLVKRWLEAKSDEALFHASVGNDPSLADVIRLAHPRPANAQRRALYAFLVGRKIKTEELPKIVRDYKKFRDGETLEIPKVPFQMLSSLPLSTNDWKQIALNGGWHMVRMNLNTFSRHGVLEDNLVVKALAKKLTDREAIRKAKAFPYQILATFLNTRGELPAMLSSALETAMEIATENVPGFRGKTYVCVDVSGSMGQSVTGSRGTASSKVRCIDVAALFAASILRRNYQAEVLAFEDKIVKLTLNGEDSVMKNAEKLAAVGGGGTNCSAPLYQLNAKKAKGDLVIYISDNESWMDGKPKGRGTAMAAQWAEFKMRNPHARLVSIDLTPNTTVQVENTADVLNVGGFNDKVFTLIESFAAGQSERDVSVAQIEKVSL